MKWSRWYVAEISYFDGNPKHKSIVQCIHENPETVEIVQSDGRERIQTDRLRHFKVVTEIEDMRDRQVKV